MGGREEIKVKFSSIRLHPEPPNLEDKVLSTVGVLIGCHKAITWLLQFFGFTYSNNRTIF
ncbi:hypothetical protein YC2023_083778 [Brassica napus]